MKMRFISGDVALLFWLFRLSYNVQSGPIIINHLLPSDQDSLVMLNYKWLNHDLVFSSNNFKTDGEFDQMFFNITEENKLRVYFKFTKTMLTTSKYASKQWIFKTLPKHIIKFTFLLNQCQSRGAFAFKKGFSSTKTHQCLPIMQRLNLMTEQEQRCEDQSHFAVYDGVHSQPSNLISLLCAKDILIHPIVYCPSHMSVLVLIIKRSFSLFASQIDVEAEIVAQALPALQTVRVGKNVTECRLTYSMKDANIVLDLPSSDFFCNTSKELTNDISYLYPEHFPQLHVESVTCTNEFLIPTVDFLQGFGQVNVLSLSINESSPGSCIHKLSFSADGKSQQDYCGFESTNGNPSIKFNKVLNLEVTADKNDFHQGFLLSIDLKYCPFGMHWDNVYCNAGSIFFCESFTELEDNIIISPTCIGDCKCPPDKPLWKKKCVSLKQCMSSSKLLFEEVDNTTTQKKQSLVRRVRAFDKAFQTTPAPLPHRNYRPRFEKNRIRCYNSETSLSYCIMQRALNRCFMQSVIDDCRYTCSECDTNSWSSWTSWSTCSRDCERGKQLRFQTCQNCDQTARIEMRDCERVSCSSIPLGLGVRSAFNRQQGSIPPDICGAFSFQCVSDGACINDTKVCNGYFDCSDRSDESGNCPLGLRFDGKRVISNWATHHCLDVDISSTNILTPWGFRRCPGQWSNVIERYWWRYRVGRYSERGGLLEHQQTKLCLSVKVRNLTMGGFRTIVTVELQICDFSYRSRNQLWECEPSSLKVRLTFPDDVLPQVMRAYRYLSLSEMGPGMTLVMTDQRISNGTDFHILESELLNICSERQASDYQLVSQPALCSKSCGGGTKEVLRDCARSSTINCLYGKRYERIPCNTEPCPSFCPPDWTVVGRGDIEDIGCYKLFSFPLRNFQDAGAFCSSNNWTLAADKNKQTHEALLTVMAGEAVAYIGIYEDILEPQGQPPPHLLRYALDRQPVGSFQPWTANSPRAGSSGCVLGSGGSYYGTLSTDINGASCGLWNESSTRRYNVLEELEKPYFPYSSQHNFCRNPNLDPMGPWCYNEGRNSFDYCGVPDCLEYSADFRNAIANVDREHVFLIRSRHGKYFEKKWCLSSPSRPQNGTTIFAVLLPCNVESLQQLFYWLSETTIVNIATKSCLSSIGGPPEHGEKLGFQQCQRSLENTYQAWIASDYYFLSASLTEARDLETRSYRFKLEFDPIALEPCLVDAGRSLFVTWTKELGSLSPSSLLQHTPGGRTVLLRSCGRCLTHDLTSRLGILRIEPCSQQRTSQRWVILSIGHLMNAASGQCMSSTLQGYAITVKCSTSDPTQTWFWDSTFIVATTEESGTTVMRHRTSGYYLHCGCSGLSSVCLAPTSAGASAWTFIPGAFGNSRQKRAEGSQRAAAQGVLGYPFLLRSAADLTRCARPFASLESNLASSIRVRFFPCLVQDTGFYWWFSGLVTQIKHKNLDLCLDANLRKMVLEQNITDVEVHLKPCSISKLDTQSWIFTKGFSREDGNDLVGEYIRLASNSNFYLSLKSAEDGRNFILVLHHDDDRDKWEAFAIRKFPVKLSEMQDCARPWIKMVDYRGTRSWTRTGIRCQPWNSQIPYRHPFFPYKHTRFGLNENYCRRPPGPPTDILDRKGEDRAWCMSLSPKVRWQDCVVSRCKLPSVITLVKSSRSWTASSGMEKLPFVCQSSGECYHEYGVNYRGLTTYTGQGYCLNWREYYNGRLDWPDHNRCLNPNGALIRPWCWVARGALQYCETLRSCTPRCFSPMPMLQRMKLAGISYATSSAMYAVGSRVQVVCKQGYNVSLPNGRQDQIITCLNTGIWYPPLVQCRKMFCPNPMKMQNAYILTTQTRFTYGEIVAYQCRSGYMIRPGQVTMQLRCQANGEWSEIEYKCLPSCPPGWINYRFSCYSVKINAKMHQNFEQAEEECRREGGGNLFVPNTESEYQFARYLIMKMSGFSETPLWVGISDSAASQSDLTARSWVPNRPEQAVVYLDRMRNYQHFRIRNVGSIIQQHPRLLYTDRCMFGDRRTGRVFLRSCTFEGEEGLNWSWLTHQHLYNVDLGLCLSADMFDPFLGATLTMPASVRLERCDFASARQKFTCGPHTGYLLKLREVLASFLTVRQLDVTGEVVVGGAHVTGPLSQWNTIPGGLQLCHWEIKPPDSYFIVHEGVTPPGNSFTRYDMDKCLRHRTGAVLAALPQTTARRDPVFDDEYDNGDLASASLVQGDPCARPNTAGGRPAMLGISPCAIEERGDSLCRRTDGSSPQQQPVPQWCGTMSVVGPDDHFMSPRQCNSHLLGYLCETRARWLCRRPFMPVNSIPLNGSHEFTNMRYAHGSNITLQCHSGYRFTVASNTVTIKCNHRLEWEVAVESFSANELRFFAARDMQAAAANLRCIPVRCPALQSVPGLITTMSNDPGRSDYEFGTTVTFTCITGTIFSQGPASHVARCSEDGSWQPPLNPRIKCRTVQCRPPPAILHADILSATFGYGGYVNYTCPTGKWFGKNLFRFDSVCNASALWHPDPSLQGCSNVYCLIPNATELKRIRAFIHPNLPVVVYKSYTTLTCESGFWFDKGTTNKQLTCDALGNWEPVAPERLQCSPVYCDEISIIDGATIVGSDNSGGSRVTVRCSTMTWIRPSFKIYSPHWGLCISAEGGASPLLDTPLERSPFGPAPFSAALTKNCADQNSRRDVWVWHWSFHLRNRFTNTCLTATAMPTFNDDIASVTVEKCDRKNTLQQWRCDSSPDGGNARFLSLRIPELGAFLTTNTYDRAYWSQKERVHLVVSGDYTTTSVRNDWFVYGETNPSENICSYRAGHPVEELRCSEEGNWIPHPRDVVCSVVDCGPPPMAASGETSVNRPSYIQLTNSHFLPPSAFEDGDPVEAVDSYHPVSTVVSYNCNARTRGAYTSSLVCRETGMWQNADTGRFIDDPRELEMFVCGSVTCITPNLVASSYARIYPSPRPKFHQGRRVPVFRGYITYSPGMTLLYKPEAGTRIEANCLEGFWVNRTAVRVVPSSIEQFNSPGTPFIEAECQTDGTWSEPILETGFNCTPVHCQDPGYLLNSRRYPQQHRLANPFGSIFLYECNVGFWFSPAQSYVDLRCNDCGVWIPPLETLKCIPASCREPPAVAHAIRQGDNFTVGATLLYSCENGRFLSGSNSIINTTCLSSGFWFPPQSTIRCELVECAPLPLIPFSSYVNFTRQHHDIFVPGDYALLRCNEGFEFDTGFVALYLICNQRGFWRPITRGSNNTRLVRCYRVRCPAPPRMLATTGIYNPDSADSYRFQDVVRFMCPAGSWLPPSGYGTTMTTKCMAERRPGQALDDPFYRIYWQPDFNQFFCNPLRCPHPGIKAFSRLTLGTPTFMSVAIYACQEGYRAVSPTIEGFATRAGVTCTGEGLWYPNPNLVSCEAVECPDPGEITFALRLTRLRAAAPFYFGDRVTYVCFMGRYFVDVDDAGNVSPGRVNWTITCQQDGRWSSRPSDLATSCEPVSCAEPPIVANALTTNFYFNSTDSNPAPSRYPVNARYSISCRQGYVNSQNGLQTSLITCSQRGVWMPINPLLITCERIHCVDPGNFSFTSRVVDGFRLRDRITYFADRARAFSAFPVGSPRRSVTLECTLNGQWRVLRFDQVTFEGDDSLPEQYIRTYFNRSTQLLRSSDFSSHILNTVAVQCPPPSPQSTVQVVQTGTTVIVLNQNWTLYSGLTFQCNSGLFLLDGNTNFTINCSDTGHWFPEPRHISCYESLDLHTCVIPIPVTNSSIRIMPLDSRNVYVECYAGFQFSPGVFRIRLSCDMSGVWSPDVSLMACSPIVCSPPPNVTGTTHTYTSATYGALATYRCPTGQSFTGYPNGTLLHTVCVASLLWDPDPRSVSCRPIDCGAPDYFLLPNSRFRNITTTTYSSIAWFGCPQNFHYIAENGTTYAAVPATCDEDGIWRLSSRNATSGVLRARYCQPIICGRPPNIPNSNVISTSGSNFGAITLVQCAPGFRANTSAASSPTSMFTLRCGDVATWVSVSQSTFLPTCLPLECPLLSSIANGAFVYNGGAATNRLFGDTVTLTCNPGFTTSFGGIVTLECVRYGDWAPSFSQLQCISNECPTPPTMQFATGNGDTTVGRRWTYVCIAGYEVEPGVNQVSIDCVAPGTWSPAFRIVQRCRPLQCAPPVLFPTNTRAITADGREIPSSASQVLVNVGTTVEFRCFDGFYIMADRTHSRKVLCDNLGVYNPDPATLPGCVQIICPDPARDIVGATSAGKLQSQMYLFGYVIRYTCPTGQFVPSLRLKVVDVACGENGTFVPNPSGLACANVNCQAFGMSFAESPTTSGYSIGDMITYRCLRGAWFRQGQPQQTYVCTEDGRWRPSFDTVRCRRIQCPVPVIPNAINTSATVDFASDYRIICERGYYVSGGSSFTCNENGQLDPPASSISCNPLMCGNPPLGQFTRLTTSNLQFGMPIEVRCFPGYWIRPGLDFFIIHCLADGRWSRGVDQVNCVPVRCTRPPRPRESYIFGNGSSFGSIVTVTCEPGYWFPRLARQSVQVKCNQRGNWFPILPAECSSIQCEIPISIMHATMVYDGSVFRSTAIYTCNSYHWIAHRNNTHWVLTGEKRVVSVCGDTGSWTPYPSRNFICLSLFLGDVLIDSPAVTASNTINRNLGNAIQSYHSLLRTARASWIEFDDISMTISDSYLPDLQRRPDDVYRDVRFAWDGNPLSFWAAPTTQIRQLNEWTIDIYFGKPLAVYALMIMCADDGETDITTFSLVFAGVDKQPMFLGPYRVYGDNGIEGTPQTDFPLNYSSVAIAWVYSGFASEMLWLHIVIHGTTKPDATPAIRELGFFASEAVWELTYPIDPTPAVFFVIIFSIVLVILAPVLLYMDYRYQVVTVFTPPFKENFSKALYEISFCLLINKVPPPSIHMLFRIICTGDSCFSIPWIRGSDYPKLFGRKRNYCSIIMHTNDFKLCDQTCLDVLAWRVEEDPLVGYPRILDPDKEPYVMKITDVRVTNLESGEMWRSTHEYQASTVGRTAIPYFILPHEIRRVTMKAYHVWPLLETALFKLIRCHHAFAMFSPPQNSQLRRVDRLLMALLYIVAAIVLTASLQIFMGILPPTNVDPSLQMFSQDENGETVLFLRGQRGLLALSLISCLLCIPLSFIIRFVFIVDKFYFEKREGAKDMKYEFCSHEIFFSLNVLRLPFMKILSRPLATILSVIIRNIPQGQSGRQLKGDEIFIAADKYLAKRWSFPDLHEVNEKRPFYDVVEAELLIPGSTSHDQFSQGDWKIKRGCGYPESQLLKIRYPGVSPDVFPPMLLKSSKDGSVATIQEILREENVEAAASRENIVHFVESAVTERSDIVPQYATEASIDAENLPEQENPLSDLSLASKLSDLPVDSFDDVKTFKTGLADEYEIAMGVDEADAKESSSSFSASGLTYRERNFDESGLFSVEHDIDDIVDRIVVGGDDTPVPLTIREKTFSQLIDAVSSASQQGPVEELSSFAFDDVLSDDVVTAATVTSVERSIPFQTYSDERVQSQSSLHNWYLEEHADPELFSLHSDPSKSTVVLLERNPSFQYDYARYYPHVESLWPEKSDETNFTDSFGGRFGDDASSTNSFPIKIAESRSRTSTEVNEDLLAYELSSALQSLSSYGDIEQGLASFTSFIQSDEKLPLFPFVEKESVISETTSGQALDSSPDERSIEVSSLEQGRRARSKKQANALVPQVESVDTSTVAPLTKGLKQKVAEYSSSHLAPPPWQVDSDTKKLYDELSSEEVSVQDFWLCSSTSALTESSFESQPKEVAEENTTKLLKEKALYEKIFDKSSENEDTSDENSTYTRDVAHTSTSNISSVKLRKDSSVFETDQEFQTDQPTFHKTEKNDETIPMLKTIWSIDSSKNDSAGVPAIEKRVNTVSTNSTASTDSKASAGGKIQGSASAIDEEIEPLRNYASFQFLSDDDQSAESNSLHFRDPLDVWNEVEMVEDDEMSSSAHALANARTTGGGRKNDEESFQISSTSDHSDNARSLGERSDESSEPKDASSSQVSLGHSAPFPSGFISGELPTIRRIFPSSSEGKNDKKKLKNQPLTEINYFKFEDSSNACTGNPRLHHPVVTHVTQRDPVCPFPFQFHHLLSLFLLLGIVTLFMFLLWLGQNMSTNAAEPVYRGAFFSFLTTFTIGLLFDAIIGRYIFREV